MGPSTPVLSNFDGTEYPLSEGGNWTRFGDGTLGKSSGTAYGANNDSGWAIWNPLGDITDCEAYFKIASVGAGLQSFWLIARVNDPDTSTWDGYLLDFSYDTTTYTWKYFRVSNGSWTELDSATSTAWAAGDKVLFRVANSGSNVVLDSEWYKTSSGLWEASPLGSYTDVAPGSTYTSAGQIGFGVQRDGDTVDDFGGGSLDEPETNHPTSYSNIIGIRSPLKYD